MKVSRVALSSLQVPLDVPVAFEPRVFGFRIHGRKSIVKAKLEKVGNGKSPMQSLRKGIDRMQSLRMETVK
jgi:hypothetical protein